MPLLADYHTHTCFSHGTGTPEQNVQAALALGLKEIAISEHNGGHLFYGVRGKNLLALNREIARLQSAYGGRIRISLGVEANLLGDGVTDLPPHAAEQFHPVLLGYHKGVFPRGATGWRWEAGLLFGQSPRYARQNAMAVAHALERNPGIFAVTHPGLYIPMDIPTLAKACVDNGAAFELNAGHSGLTLEMIQQAALEPGLTFLLSSDAHQPQQVGQVDRAAALARQAGVLHRVINWAQA